MKQGQGRIEKTEIIEMAIRHIKNLQTLAYGKEKGMKNCCANTMVGGYKECIDDVMRYMIEKQGYNANDSFCLDLHAQLQQACYKFQTRMSGTQKAQHPAQHHVADSPCTYNNVFYSFEKSILFNNF